SIVAKQHIELDQVSGIATTLAAKKVCQNAFEVSQELEVRSLVVSDQDTVDACLKFVDDHRILVEPACGATLSVLYDQAIQFKPADQVLVIVCGGAGITLETLQAFNG
ncbi:MAG: pyridoxal-phosphate dependent enzyme, partial [Pseudomonadota bacterium]